MNEQVQPVIDSLQRVKDVILRVHPTASAIDKIDVPLSVVFNSNFPAISKKKIIDFIDIEVSRLKNLNTAFSEIFLNNLEELASYVDTECVKIELLFSQSNALFFDKIVSIISIVNLTFQQYFDWEHVEDLKKVPREVKQRVLTVQQSLNEVEESSQEIQSKIKTINEAYDAATELPVLLEDLKRSRVDIDLVKNNSNTGYANIQSNKTRSENDLTSIQNTKQAAEILLDEAREILKQMQEKLTMSTSTGLAHAFSNRSDQLKKTSTWWTGGFIVSLIFTFLIAFNRFNDLKERWSHMFEQLKAYL